MASGLRDVEPLRAEASEHPRHCPERSTPRQAMDVDPNEELISLRAQVAELQSERQAIQEAESSRSNKARTSALRWRRRGQPFCGHVQFDQGIEVFFDAFELEFVERCSVWVAGCSSGRGITPRTSAFRVEKIANVSTEHTKWPLRMWSPRSQVSRQCLQVRFRCQHRALSLQPLVKFVRFGGGSDIPVETPQWLIHRNEGFPLRGNRFAALGTHGELPDRPRRRR